MDGQTATAGFDPMTRDDVIRRSIPYTIAVLSVLLATLLRYAFDSLLTSRYTVSFYFLAVVAAAFIGGTRPALLTIILGWVIAVFLFVEPRFGFGMLPTADVIGSIIFLIVGLTIALLTGRMNLITRRAQREARLRAQEVERLAERLNVADRLSLVGTLTAGVGHDIANLLFPITSRLQSIDRELQQAGITSQDMQTLYAASNYLANLTRGLSHLTVDPHAVLSGRTDVDSWIETIKPLLSAALPGSIKLHCEAERDLPPLAIAPHALTQAVFNAVQNAGKAIAPRPGHVNVNAQWDERQNSICVLIRDDGPGIPPHVLQQLDTPSIHAHENRGASGLGLSIIRSIVEGAGGSLRITSSPDRETELRLTIPVASSAEASNRHSSTLHTDTPRGAAAGG